MPVCTIYLYIISCSSVPRSCDKIIDSSVCRFYTPNDTATTIISMFQSVIVKIIETLKMDRKQLFDSAEVNLCCVMHGTFIDQLTTCSYLLRSRVQEIYFPARKVMGSLFSSWRGRLIVCMSLPAGIRTCTMLSRSCEPVRSQHSDMEVRHMVLISNKYILLYTCIILIHRTSNMWE